MDQHCPIRKSQGLIQQCLHFQYQVRDIRKLIVLVFRQMKFNTTVNYHSMQAYSFNSLIFHYSKLTLSGQNIRGMFYEKRGLNAYPKSIDPGQSAHSAQTDLSRSFLPIITDAEKISASTGIRTLAHMSISLTIRVYQQFFTNGQFSVSPDGLVYLY